MRASTLLPVFTALSLVKADGNFSTSYDIVTDLGTKLLTVTSCANNACSETVQSTGFYVQTLTSTGVVTETTIYCPLTATETNSTTEAAVASYSNITSAFSTSSEEFQVATTQSEIPTTLPEVSTTLPKHTLAPIPDKSSVSSVNYPSTVAAVSFNQGDNLNLEWSAGVFAVLGGLLFL